MTARNVLFSHSLNLLFRVCDDGDVQAPGRKESLSLLLPEPSLARTDTVICAASHGGPDAVGHRIFR